MPSFPYAKHIDPNKVAVVLGRRNVGLTGIDVDVVNTTVDGIKLGDINQSGGIDLGGDVLPCLKVAGGTAGDSDIALVNYARERIGKRIFESYNGANRRALIWSFCYDVDVQLVRLALTERLSDGNWATSGDYVDINTKLNSFVGSYRMWDITSQGSMDSTTPGLWSALIAESNTSLFEPTTNHRYKDILEAVHLNYDLYNSLLLKKIGMNPHRIRTSRFVTVDGKVVRSYSEQEFTTAFQYLKKDPNGQFVAGGLRRCPTFSGQSSSGYIPDDVNKGHALFSSYLDNTVLSPSSHQYSTPYVTFAKSFTSSTGTYKLRSKITQEIRLPPSGGYSSGTFFLSAGTISNFTIKIRAFNLNWSNKTLASGTTTFNQTSFGIGQYGTVSTNIIMWPSFGNLLYETDANGRPIPPTPGEVLFHRISFASPIDQFVETDANGERWIRPCYIEQEIPGNWYTAPFTQSAIYSSSTYYSGGLKAAMADNSFWPTVDSEGKPIYIRLYHGFTSAGQIFGNLPVTNFDFAETV